MGLCLSAINVTIGGMGSQQVYREGQTIYVTQLSSPNVVNELLFNLHSATDLEYTFLELDFGQVTAAYPNVCTPIAGILEFYRHEKKIEINCRNVPPYVKKVHMLNPIVLGTVERNLDSSLNTVWKFASSQEVNDLTTAFVRDVSRKIVCESGLLQGLEWCLNEVMDNVIQHASPTIGMQHGYVMAQVHEQNHQVALCVYDYGQGIYNSLKNHPHAPKSCVDAITMAIQEGVTRDKKIGQGNGLWGLQKIIQLNAGSLTILSGKGRCASDGKEFVQNSDQKYIDQDHQSTTVDFQLNCDKTVSIAEALNGYCPVNLRMERVEDDQARTIPYRLAAQASGTGTRQSGERIRNEILNLMKESSYRIVIDFSGISVVSSSFADELIGKLVWELGFTGFTQRVQLAEMNDFIAPIVDRSVAQRIAELFNR
jgi:anti-sigma regulatory factor (Ser/Thr protein kinase)